MRVVVSSQRKWKYEWDKKWTASQQAAGNYITLVINRLFDRQHKEHLMCNIQHRILVNPGAFLHFQPYWFKQFIPLSDSQKVTWYIHFGWKQPVAAIMQFKKLSGTRIKQHFEEKTTNFCFKRKPLEWRTFTFMKPAVLQNTVGDIGFQITGIV